MRPPALAFIWLLFSGCPTVSPPCEAKAVPLRPEQQRSWADDSGPALALLFPLQAFTCASEGPVADAVTGEVLSPTNARLPVTVEPVVDPGTEALGGARLTFTPSEGPGVYLATATFLPVGGRPSSSVLVVGDRRQDPAAVTLPRSCTAVARLASGAWVCDGEVFQPDGGTTSLFPKGAQLAAAGATLWAHGATTLRAWREEDGGLEPLGQVSTGYVGEILALEDSAVLFGPSGMRRVQVSDGGLQGGDLLGVTHGALLPSARGDRLYVPRDTPDKDDLGNDVHEVCRWRLDPSMGSPEGCQPLKGRLLGGWDGVYLTHSRETDSLRAWAPGPDGALLLVDSLALPPGELSALDPLDPLFSGAWPQLTDLSDAALVARVRGGKILLEHLGSLPAGLTSQQDATWGLLENGSTAAWPNLP